MASTGFTTFTAIANFLESESRPRYTAKEINKLKKLDAIIPMINDAVSAIQADTSSYPEGHTIEPLDVAFNIAIAMISE